MNAQAAELLVTLRQWRTPPDNAWSRLSKLLEKNSDSEFGRAFGFDSIRTPRDFRSAIPPMSYEQHRSWIERAAAGEPRVLACDELIGFERTSGTSSEAKWIPITTGLQEEFACGLATWFGAWETRIPEVFGGRSYWAISPPGMKQEFTLGGLPVGMTSDAAYFPSDIGECLANWLILPSLSGNTGSFFEETAEALLAAPDLSLVSVWSPTFLLGIDAAVRRLRGGRTWSEIWPKLARVSCWADASSAMWIPRLQERLGKIPVEAKGLLATEGITSIPDAIDGSPRLAERCHWLEFIDETGTYVSRSELRVGGIYEILLTTAGGLFRYRSGDRVRVVGCCAETTPHLRFVGRADGTCDLVGEKLHETHVIEVLAGRGLMVADATRPGYDLWLEDLSDLPAIERCLRLNPYLDQALTLHQLKPLRIRRLPDEWYSKLADRLASHRGCRIGDIKPPVLLTRETPEEVASWLD